MATPGRHFSLFVMLPIPAKECIRMGPTRSPQSASLRVEELEQRSLPSAASVAAAVHDLTVDIQTLKGAVDNFKVYTTNVVTNVVNDLKNGTDPTADLHQLDRLLLAPGPAVVQLFAQMRTTAGKAQDIQNDLTIMQRWATQLKTFLGQQVQKVHTDLNNNVDATKDLYLIETGVNYFDMRMGQAEAQFLTDLSHHHG
jgi:hypothetical protein